MKAQDVEFRILDEEAPSLIGRFLELREYTFPKLGKPSEVAIFDTDGGTIGVMLGQSAIQVLKNPKLEGKIMRVTFEGVKESSSGREYKEYSIEVIED